MDCTVKITGLAMGAKSGHVAAKGVSRTGTRKRGKYTYEVLEGNEFDCDGRLMHKTRIFDRQNDIYSETVIDADTGEVRHKDERGACRTTRVTGSSDATHRKLKRLVGQHP